MKMKNPSKHFGVQIALRCKKAELSPIPLIPDTKQPFKKQWGWIDFPMEDFMSERLPAVGVLLGPRSFNLCSVDLDTDDMDDIYELCGIYRDINPVEIHRGGRPTHFQYRIGYRDEEHYRITKRTAALPYQRTDGRGAGLELLMGGYRDDGFPQQSLVVVFGKHKSGQLVKYHPKFPAADDFPVLTMEESEELWEMAVERLGATVKEDSYSGKYYGSSDLDCGGLDMHSLISFAAGSSEVFSTGHSYHCPFCGRKSFQLFDERFFGKCWHANSCPSKAVGRKDDNGVNVWQVFAHLLGLDFREDREVLDWFAVEVSAGRMSLAEAQRWEDKVAPWSFLDVSDITSDVVCKVSEDWEELFGG